MFDNIKKLDEELKKKTSWEFFPKINLQMNSLRQNQLVSILNYYAYNEKRHNETEKIIWNSLILNLIQTLDELHKTKIRNSLAKLAPQFLYEYSYFHDESFRQIEEKAVLVDETSDIVRIPKKAWDNFWLTIDIFKNQYLDEIFYEPKKLFDKEHMMLQYLIDYPPGKLNPLSPFRYGIPILITIAGIITDANALMIANYQGIAAASLIAGYVGIGTGAVFSAKGNDLDSRRNDRFINILKERLAQGKITKEQYLDLKKTIEDPDSYN